MRITVEYRVYVGSRHVLTTARRETADAVAREQGGRVETLTYTRV